MLTKWLAIELAIRWRADGNLPTLSIEVFLIRVLVLSDLLNYACLGLSPLLRLPFKESQLDKSIKPILTERIKATRFKGIRMRIRPITLPRCSVPAFTQLA